MIDFVCKRILNFQRFLNIVYMYSKQKMKNIYFGQIKSTFLTLQFPIYV